MKDLRLYILMRNDLPSMNPGKAMAQACHAANQFIHEHPKKTGVKQWQAEGNGFGTTIVLSVNLYEMNVALAKIKRFEWQYPCGEVVDTTYPFIVNKEIAQLIPDAIQTAPACFKENGNVVLFRSVVTCGYVFADGEALKDILGEFPLHP
jgi:peptidyl-tRNA hydrolase